MLQLLLLHPAVFVDFGAWSPDYFVANYGVTAQQMATLAKEGLVIPSLCHFDSYRAAVQNDPDDRPGYEQDECQHLKVLFRYDETGCRIASIRRNGLFEAIGLNPDPRQWEYLFSDALHKLTNNERRELTGQPDVRGALKRLSNNYNYVRKLGNEDPGLSV